MTSTASLLAYTFNQDATCLAIGTDRGYQIFTCEPWASAHSCSEVAPPHSPPQRRRRTAATSSLRLVCQGGVGVVELLHSSSLVALVGAGTRPGESTRRLVMLNTRTNTSICELNFSSSVLRVRMNASRLLVELQAAMRQPPLKKILLHDTVVGIQARGRKRQLHVASRPSSTTFMHPQPRVAAHPFEEPRSVWERS